MAAYVAGAGSSNFKKVTVQHPFNILVYTLLGSSFALCLQIFSIKSSNREKLYVLYCVVYYITWQINFLVRVLVVYTSFFPLVLCN